MPKTVDNYIIQKELFKDAFQIQYLSCQHKVLKKPFTLKKIQKPHIQCQSKQQQKINIKLSFALQSIQNEIDIIRQLKSQKVIKCLKILKAKNTTYAVYDEHPQKNLQRILLTQYLTFQKKQTILNEILTLIKQAHQLNIAIGNIQPKYLYFTSQNKLLTSNFLIAKRLIPNTQNKIQPLFLDSKSAYYAPQLLLNGNISKAVDMYSLGVIIKNLKLQNDNSDLLSPTKYCYDTLKQLTAKMTDRNPLNRPTIEEVQKVFSLNRSRNKSTAGSSASRDNDEKMADLKGLETCKSEATLKYIGSQKIQASTLLQSRSRKVLDRKQSLNPQLFSTYTSKKIALKSKASCGLQSSRYQRLQIPMTRKSRQQQSAKSGSSSNNLQKSLNKTSSKQKLHDIMLIRNVVSFLLQMALFISEQNLIATSKDLSKYLIQQAVKYTNNLMKIIDYLMKQEQELGKNLNSFYEQCKKQKQKLLIISANILTNEQNKGNYQLLLIEQLKKLGKNMLALYSNSFTQTPTSRTSDRPYKLANESINYKQIQDKLFKTLLILKKLQYGSYYDFFKAKTHHPSKKFWSQHYFQFERTFGGKYFMIQMKDLIAKK